MTGKQLVQGCYAVAWVEVEPTTSELQGRTLFTAPRSTRRTFSEQAIGLASIIDDSRREMGDVAFRTAPPIGGLSVCFVQRRPIFCLTSCYIGEFSFCANPFTIILYKVITTMVIRPLDERTYYARSASPYLGLSESCTIVHRIT